MIEDKNIEGQYVKTQFMFIHKQRNENNWKAGVVVSCHKDFACVQFEQYKKCFSYNELTIIDKKEYHELQNQKQFRKSLIFIGN